MPVSEEFTLFILEQLHDLGNVRSKRMFGGVGIYSNDRFFALIENDTLRFKVDESNRKQYEQQGMSPFKPYVNKKTVMQYYEVPAHVIEDSDMLVSWARQSIDIARNAAD